MKTIEELKEQKRELNMQLNAIYDIAEKRELNDEEKQQERELTVKLARCEREIDNYILERKLEEVKPREAEKTVNAYIRELLKGARDGKSAREVTLFSVSGNPKGSVTESGAINLDIKDLVPTIQEGLGLPTGLTIVTGVTGDQLIPYGIDDAEIKELGETTKISAQNLHFDMLKVTQARVGMSIRVSNMAIDNAAFDLMGYIRTKFPLAVRRFLAEKILSQAAFTGIKGPNSGLTAAGTIKVNDGKAYKNVLKAIAQFADKGFAADDVCVVMDAVTEAEFKATPKLASGVGGFMIENGKFCGYDYIVSHFVNTKLKGGSGTDKNDIVATADKSILIGLWQFLQVQQHGTVRLNIDATSDDVATENVTAITMNSAYSITDLSTKINGGNGQTGANATQAFARYVLDFTEPTA